MIRRIALISGCVALSALALGGKASAQSVDVDFNGVVAPSCVSSNVVNGVLKLATNPANFAVLSSDPIEATGASVGKFDLNCNGGAAITINIPTVLAGSAPAASTANYGAALRDGATNLTAFAVVGGAPQTANVVAPITNKTYGVHLFVQNNGIPLPAGNYNYRVNLNIVAN